MRRIFSERVLIFGDPGKDGACSQWLAIHPRLVPFGVGVGIGIDPHCVLCLIVVRYTSGFSLPNPTSSLFDTDSDTDPDTEVALPIFTL
jgi:hypothetical protein